MRKSLLRSTFTLLTYLDRGLQLYSIRLNEVIFIFGDLLLNNLPPYAVNTLMLKLPTATNEVLTDRK